MINPLSQITVTPQGKEQPRGPIPTQTALFRDDTQLHTALDLALDSWNNEGEDRPFVVMSVGSSYGAEADSILGYSELQQKVGKVILTGVDVNPDAVEQAKVGKYDAVSHMVTTATEYYWRDLVDYLPMFDVAEKPEGHETYTIDTTKLRAKHHVDFIQADLTTESPDLPKADLIVANNLLYHLTPEKAESLVRSMAKYLKVGGVMSFGSNVEAYLMRTDDQSFRAEKPSYIKWLRTMELTLSRAGIEPLLFSRHQKAAFMYRKNTE